MIGSIKNFIAQKAEYNMINPENFVRNTQVITTPFYYAYQSLAYYRSPNVQDDKRKFIVAQTLAEGAMTTVLALFVPKGLSELGKKLVNKGIIRPSSGIPAHLMKNQEAIAKLLDGKAGNEQHIKLMKNFKNNVAMATTIFGIFLTFGVITPIVRNFMAKYLQNYIKAGEAKKKTQNTKPQTFQALNIKGA